MPLIQRFSTIQRGAIVITGNTLGLSKGNGLNPGTIGSIGGFITTDIALPTPAAWAGYENLANDENITLNWQENSSRAVLDILPSSSVVYAELIWGGSSISLGVDVTANIDDDINLITPSGTVSVSPDPVTSDEFNFNAALQVYIRSQDVTSIVQNSGAGIYEVSSVPSAIATGNAASNSAGWSLIVVYGNSSLPVRRMDVYSSGVYIDAAGGNVDVNISGFATPSVGPINGRIIISALEGDANITRDTMLFGPNAASLTKLFGPNNKSNPPFPGLDNFFGSQINIGDPNNPNVGQVDTRGTYGGRNQNLIGDTNIIAGRQGWDVTNVDASNTLINSQTSAVTRFTTNGDGYVVNGLALQIDAVAPDIIINKSTLDLVIDPGDPINYTITIENNGTVTTDDFNFLDLAPVGTTIDLGSINIFGATGPVVNNSTISEVNLDLGPVNIGQIITIDFTLNTVSNTPKTVTNSATGTYSYAPVVGVSENGSSNSNVVTTNINLIEFVCSSIAYQFAQSPTNAYEINLVTGNTVFVGDVSLTQSINAIGYNTVDNLIYGYNINQNEIVYVDATYTPTVFTPRPPNLPVTPFNIGTFDDNGYFYLARSNISSYYVVDLDSSRPTFGKLVDPTNGFVEQTVAPFGVPYIPAQTIGGADWAFNPVDDYLYTVRNNGDVVRVNSLTGDLEVLNSNGLINGGYGAIFSYSDGTIYAIENNTGRVYRIIISGNDANGSFFSQSIASGSNDGASCVNARVEIDFGDAPDVTPGNGPFDYKTLLSNDGARHGIINELTLGSFVTSENDAYQNSSATGDDVILGVQDDGPTIIPLTPILYNASGYSFDVNVLNNTGFDANLYAWLDFNQNGIFETNEGFNTIVSSSPLNQAININFNKPLGIPDYIGNTFVRVRLTTDDLVNTGGLTDEDTRSFGPAGDGEVEDYIIDIIPAPFDCDSTAYRVSN